MRIASVRRRMRDERLDKSNHYLGECDCRYRACLLFIQGATNMMTKEEIMKVLDAMNYAISPSGTFWVKKHNEAKQILQAALAEPSEPDKDLIQALTERDEYHEMADKLAEGIALHFDGDIGEHGSSNSPWDRALDLLDSAACAETMRLSKQAALAEPSEPVRQYRKAFCANWYDGYPDQNDGGGPYETRTLFTHPASKPEPLTDEEISEVFEKCASLQAIPGNGRHTVHSALVGVAEGIEFARAVEAAVLEKLK